MAFDGNEGTFWGTEDDLNVGSWIKFNLVGVCRLTKIMVMGRDCGGGNLAKDVSLQFLNGVQMDFTLDDTLSWQTIDLEGIGKHIMTDSAKITIDSVYRRNTGCETGFREFQVFGLTLGMRYNDNVTKHYRSGNFPYFLII